METKGSVLLILTWISLSAINAADDCSFTIKLDEDTCYYDSNKDFENFLSTESCVWKISAPADSSILITVYDYELPCTTASLKIIPNGNEGNVKWCEGGPTRKKLFSSNDLTIVLDRKSDDSFNFDAVAVPKQPKRPKTCKVTTSTKKDYCSDKQCDDCGYRKKNKIIGGKETENNEFPFMAALFNTETKVVNCGGSIISKRAVLTAAHCDLKDDSTSKLIVLVGQHRVQKEYETDYPGRYAIEKIIVHEDYSDETKQNDIALVITTSEIEFSNIIGPICLPYNFEQPDGTFDVTVAGWGLDEMSVMSKKLMKVKISTITPHEYHCRLPKNTLSESQLGLLTPEKDSCSHDSGGPVFWQDPKQQKYILVALVSHGVVCGGTTPSTNTRVRCFLDWIEANTASLNYNYKRI